MFRQKMGSPFLDHKLFLFTVWHFK